MRRSKGKMYFIFHKVLLRYEECFIIIARGCFMKLHSIESTVLTYVREVVNNSDQLDTYLVNTVHIEREHKYMYVHK